MKEVKEITKTAIDLISYSLFKPNKKKAEIAISNILNNSNQMLYFDSENEDGIIGIEINSKNIEITHIGVHTYKRNMNIAKKMIFALKDEFKCDIFAETDIEAVDFYEKCGFIVKNLGEKYPGITRYAIYLHR